MPTGALYPIRNAVQAITVLNAISIDRESDEGAKEKKIVSKMNIVSPAYILPKSRNPNETGLASKDTPSRKIFTGAKIQELNGCKA